MEDGVKEDSAQCKENPKFLGKAGWVKKGHGRLLASYKDRFIHVEKTDIVVYENEDLQNCLERLDLENYDKCHELKSPFKKKHRLILIRSPKTANKVHDLKFQAQTAEEKDAWIKALSDGINRAKNKVFDEVKVDESCNLEHVTRTRPKGNRNRRPPTRIHMKEVADVSSEGILRLDLDLESALMPNGTHHVSEKESNRTQAPASDVSDGAEKLSEPGLDEEVKTEAEASPQKKVIKPPMPPIKEAKPSLTPEEEAAKEDESEKKVLKPPMPPSKDLKASVLPDEEAPEETKAEKTPEKSPEVRKKTGPPPTPPNKPSSSSSISNLTEASQPRPNSHPPTPPSKEKKPSCPAAGPDQEVEGLTGEEEDEEEEEEEKKEEGDSTTEETGAAEETHEAEQTVSEESDGSGPGGPSAGRVSEEESAGKESDNDQQAPKETPRKSPSPPLVPKKKPERLVQPSEGPAEDRAEVSPPNGREDSPAQLTTDTSASPLPAEQALAKSEVPTVVVSVDDPITDSLGLSPLLGQLPGEKKKKKKTEEKSVDSGQHSDDDSEGSGSEDTLAASTAALRGSSAGLDVLDASEEDVQISVSLRHPQVPSKPQILPKSFPCRRSEPTPPPKPLTKARSASSGDLLSDSSTCSQLGQQTRVEAGSSSTPSDDVMKLEAAVALEMEKTRELLSRVSHSEAGGEKEAMPEDLLTRAMEKLKRADHVLREVRKLAPAKSSSHRKSW